MNPSASRVLRRIVSVVAFAAIIGLSVRATWYIARLPDSNCTTQSVYEIQSRDDPAYKATLLEKTCNSGEPLFHLLNIISPAGAIRNFPLESDLMRPGRPALRWTEPHSLEVVTPTDNLAGVLTEHWVGGLTVVRSYTPGTRER
jgi:hypothetical protein